MSAPRHATPRPHHARTRLRRPAQPSSWPRRRVRALLVAAVAGALVAAVVACVVLASTPTAPPPLVSGPRTDPGGGQAWICRAPVEHSRPTSSLDVDVEGGTAATPTDRRMTCTPAP